MTKLKATFREIANVSYVIRTKTQDINERLILDYWNYSIQQLEGMSPALLSLLNEQVPEISGNKIIVQARNDTERVTLLKNMVR